MKVSDLIKYLQALPVESLGKEVTFYDYKANKAHATPAKVTVVDESDAEYLDIVFNYDIDKDMR